MPIAKVGDVSLEYYVEGSGPPLLMIQGMGGQASSWGEPFMDRLRPHFTTVRFSNRGVGLSDNPGNVVTIPAMADDAAGLLRELGIEKAHVLGISMGGMIAQDFAIRHAGLVHGLVLGCTGCGPAHSVPAPPETMAKLGQMMGLPAEERVRAFWSLTVTPAFMESGSAFLEEMIGAAVAAPPEELARLQATMALQFGAISAHTSYDRLGEIKAPTLVVHGDADALVPAANGEIIHGRIAGSSMHIIQGAGHCFFWEKPEESADVIVEFLSRVPAGA
jgi:pimeloyl-ACP methyl ester carboxylesterase